MSTAPMSTAPPMLIVVSYDFVQVLPAGGRRMGSVFSLLRFTLPALNGTAPCAGMSLFEASVASI